MKVNILGTEYKIITQSVKDNPKKLKDNDGLCEFYSHKIILCKDNSDDDSMVVENVEDYYKEVLRHEIVHAYFAESGLRGNSEYAENEELVDWIAIQLPKMVKTMKEAGCL